MEKNTKDVQSIIPVQQVSVEQVFWCEPVSLVHKGDLPPSSDSPCNADPGNCSACNGNPNCSHGCA